MAKRFELYVVNGEKIASFVELPDGGARLLGWDFERGELTREAANVDDFYGGDPESYQITKEEFDRRLRELRDGAAALREEAEPKRRGRRGPPEPLTRRRGRTTEVSNLERSIRDGENSAPCGENCGHGDEVPETVEKALDVVKKIFGEDDPAG